MISHHEALFRVRHPQVIKNWYPGCQTIQEINTSRGQVRVERLFVGHVMLIYTRWVSSVLAECLARFELAGTSSARWTELTKTSTRDKMETDILKCKYSVVFLIVCVLIFWALFEVLILPLYTLLKVTESGVHDFLSLRWHEIIHQAA